MHQQPLPILSLVAQNFLFQPAVLLLLFQGLANFCSHMLSQFLLDLDQCSLSQHTVFIPELLVVCSEQEICICINEQRIDLLYQDPLNGSKNARGALHFRSLLLCNVHVRRGCNSQIRVVMLEDLVVFCNQFIHVYHSILMLCKLQQI
jgi:hypothetical protein